MQTKTPEAGKDVGDIVADGRQVLKTEAQALALLASALPADFAAVVGAMAKVRGRVIVSGIGKSGHIGRKISATLASTGTPSHFVHSAEASHGDMGMITPDDICLLISNSGETTEMRDLVAHTRRFSVPLVAISSHPESTLMQAADYRLALPPAPEACSIGMVPTTSTTMTLALGDALAVALMNRRDFKRENFHVLHPGGKLGAQLIPVSALMHGGEDLPLVTPDTPMGEVLLEMTSKGLGIALVAGPDGALQGVVTDGDLRRNMDRIMECTAGEIATTDPATITGEMLAIEALALMNGRKISVLPVVDNAGRAVGALHIHDCLRAGVA